MHAPYIFLIFIYRVLCFCFEVLLKYAYFSLIPLPQSLAGHTSSSSQSTPKLSWLAFCILFIPLQNILHTAVRAIYLKYQPYVILLPGLSLRMKSVNFTWPTTPCLWTASWAHLMLLFILFLPSVLLQFFQFLVWLILTWLFNLTFHGACLTPHDPPLHLV